MNQTSKFVLYGVAAVVALAVIGRMMTSAPPSTESAETDVLVSQLIKNDPLIAPLQTP